MHYVMLSTCVCTNYMLLSISKVLHRWRCFCRDIIGLEDRSSKLKYVLIWLEGRDVFYSFYQTIVINVVVLISIVYGRCAKVLLCLRIDEMRLCISYKFYTNDILKKYRMFVKCFNSALLFIRLYMMNVRKVSFKTSERWSTSVALQECYIV